MQRCLSNKHTHTHTCRSLCIVLLMKTFNLNGVSIFNAIGRPKCDSSSHLSKCVCVCVCVSVHCDQSVTFKLVFFRSFWQARQENKKALEAVWNFTSLSSTSHWNRVYIILMKAHRVNAGMYKCLLGSHKTKTLHRRRNCKCTEIDGIQRQ